MDEPGGCFTVSMGEDGPYNRKQVPTCFNAAATTSQQNGVMCAWAKFKNNCNRPLILAPAGSTSGFRTEADGGVTPFGKDPKDPLLHEYYTDLWAAFMGGASDGSAGSKSHAHKARATHTHTRTQSKSDAQNEKCVLPMVMGCAVASSWPSIPASRKLKRTST